MNEFLKVTVLCSISLSHPVVAKFFQYVMTARDKAASSLSKVSLPCARCGHAPGISGTPKTYGSSEPCVDRAFACMV